MKKQNLNMGLWTLLLLFVCAPLLAADSPAPADEDYDRLDGRGASGKRVDVIEWDGNLEIHIYPKGSLSGLALKLDKRDSNKTVMVIGYRFNTDPKKQLIRRALVSIPFTAQFKAYHSKNEPDFDKIVISNNGLSTELAEYKLDPEPTQLYPEDPTKKPKTSVAQEEPHAKVDPVSGQRLPAAHSETPTDPRAVGDEAGTVKPFQW